MLDAANQVDFAGLLQRAALAAPDGPPLFDHVLVDDYQDTTLAAEAVLRGLAAPDLVVAADPDAHVFSFQGTTRLPLDRFATEAFPGAERIRLSTRHRSVAEPAVTAWIAPHTSEEHAAVARELRRLHVDEGVAWSDLAVVVRRQGAHVGNLLRALDDAQVPRVGARARAVAGHRAVDAPVRARAPLARRGRARARRARRAAPHVRRGRAVAGGGAGPDPPRAGGGAGGGRGARCDRGPRSRRGGRGRRGAGDPREGVALRRDVRPGRLPRALGGAALFAPAGRGCGIGGRGRSARPRHRGHVRQRRGRGERGWRYRRAGVPRSPGRG